MTASHNARLTRAQRAATASMFRADPGEPTHTVIWIDRRGTEHPRGSPCSLRTARAIAKVLNASRTVRSSGRYDVAEL